MRECPWCGRINLNVYAYCQECGRGFAEPEHGQGSTAFEAQNLGAWLAGANPAGALPAFWPAIGALAALAFGAALLWGSTSDESLSGPLIGAGAGFLAVVVIGWMAANASSGRESAEAATTRYWQVVLVETGEPGGFGRWLRRPRDLRSLPGVSGADASVRRQGTAAQAMIRLELDDQTGPGSEAIERVVRAHAGDTARVQVFPPQTGGEAPAPRVRMGSAAAATLVGGLLIGGVAMAATYAALQDDGASDTGGATEPAGPAAPAAFDGTIVAKNSVFTVKTFQLPPATEVTLRVDNKDAGVPHNIAFYQGAEAKPPYLEGCTEGCDSGGTAVRTELKPGPVVQEFTFKTPAPGKYAFICEVHPNTMAGTLEIVEGAKPPA